LTANGCAIGFFCAALFKQIGRVTALTNIVLMPIFILAGLFNKLTSMPKWISWLQYLSPYRYGFQLIMQNEYRDEIYGLPDHPYNYQEDLGYTLNYTENFVILFVLTFGFYFMGYLLLRYNKDKVVA
jgi:ABC-type polysaccharide/polyol phosphate export permease